MNDEISFRKATAADSMTVFRLFLRTVRDLAVRQGVRAVFDGGDPEVIATVWEQRQSMFEHLARTAHQFWVAERGDEVIGYARSILRDGALELTEFFVAPDAQSDGIGRELLSRAFPQVGTRSRSIIATTDIRAQARYLKTGVYPRFPIYSFSRKPEIVEMSEGLRFEKMDASAATLAELGAVDEIVLGFRRVIDHEWFMTNRKGFLIYRQEDLMGYGYTSRGGGSGPFALCDPACYSAVLAYAEAKTAQDGLEEFVLQVPMINHRAVDYLLQRGFRLDPFITLHMSDGDQGFLDRYIVTSPPLFM